MKNIKLDINSFSEEISLTLFLARLIAPETDSEVIRKELNLTNGEWEYVQQVVKQSGF